MQVDCEGRRGLVLGVDPGWRNLGLALYDPATRRVLLWEAVDVFDGKAYESRELLPRLRASLEPLAAFDVRTVVMEQQFDRAQRLSRIEGFIAGYFSGRGARVHVVPARHLKVAMAGSELATGNYAQNKRSSVAYVERCAADPAGPLDGTCEAVEAWLAYRGGGRTDMADAMLQVLYYERFRPHLATQARFIASV